MILEIITEIINKRKEERRIPYCAPLKDVKILSGKSEKEVLEEVKKLRDERKIMIKQTINSLSFYLV